MARTKTPEEIERGIFLSNLRELLKTRHGKDFVWYVLELSGIYSHFSTSDINNLLKAEGRRTVGLDVIDTLMDADPEIYPRLLLDKQRRIEDDENG